MKVTKAMVNRAENEHFRTETYESLQKANALSAVYYKQQGDKKAYKVYSNVAPKSMIKRIEAKPDRKKSKKKRTSSSVFGSRINIRMPRF